MKLKKGEIICNKCNRSVMYSRPQFKDEPFDSYLAEIAILCNKCKGTGKLNWIENIVGKKNVKKLEIKFTFI